MLLQSVFANAQDGCDCNELLGDKKLNDYRKLIGSQNIACKAVGYELAGEEMLSQKNLDSADFFFNTALSTYKKANCPEAKYLNLYRLLAQLYDNKAAFQLSLDYNLKALPIAEKENLTVEQASILLNIGQVFNRLQQADKGIQYTRRSVPVIINIPPSSQKAELLNKVTARYFYYYQDFKDSTYADTAEFYVNQALEIAKQVKNVKEEIIALTRLNAIYESRKKYDKALHYIDEALKLCIPGVHGRQYITLYGDKGHLLMNMGKYQEARIFADSCLYYSNLDKYPPLIANAYSLIYEIENKAGNYKEALAAINNEKKITDSLLSDQRTKTINELEKKYNQAKNENTIKELAQQKKIYILLAAAGLLSLVAIGFFVRQQSLKHKQNVMEVEQRLNRARMNPHFFFNALSSLQSFALRENDGDAIASNLSKFSHIMRETLESTYKEYVTVEQEIDFLNEYLDIQKIRFPKKFEYMVTVQKELEIDELFIPAMIIQPFAENSIEHGFNNIEYKGQLLIHFSKVGKELLIEISDNGKGLSNAIKDNSEHISRASQIIKDRIYLLNIKLKTKASFSIDNNSTSNGVVVKIKLPLIYSQD